MWHGIRKTCHCTKIDDEAHKLFDSIDEDQNGSLSLPEFRKIINDYNEKAQPPKTVPDAFDQQIDDLFNALDVDNNGALGWEEMAFISSATEEHRSPSVCSSSMFAFSSLRGVVSRASLLLANLRRGRWACGNQCR